MNDKDQTPKDKPSQDMKLLPWALFCPVLVIGVVGIIFTILRKHNLYDSAALYMGLPLLLALGLSLTPKAKSAMGATMKGITISLLLATIVLGEGYICVLFAAPIFYAVGALIAYPIDRARKRASKNAPHQAAAIATILALLSLEGTTDLTTLPRHNEIMVSKNINANINEVREQLSKTPKFSGRKPFFLKIFPYPAAISGQGLGVGDERTVNFVAYKHIWWTRVEGNLILKISDSTPDHVRFSVVQDDTYLSHYLKWQSSEVYLEAADASHTKVTWKLTYERTLDPAWYFWPMQQYAVKLAANELIDHVATPDI